MIRRVVAAFVVASSVAVMLAVGTLAQDKPQVNIPNPGVPQIMTMEGAYVRAAYNNEAYVILGYRTANESVGQPWIVLDVGTTLRSGQKAQKMTRDEMIAALLPRRIPVTRNASATIVNSVDAGAGNDAVTVGLAPASIIGGNGNDTLVGGSGNDTIDGGAGNDSIAGNAGNDSLRGGAGSDTVTGGTGGDEIEGDSTAAMLLGVAYNDSLLGGEGGEGAAEINPLAFQQDLALWTAVVFLVLLAILWRFAWGPVAGGLDKRERQIADQIAFAIANSHIDHDEIAFDGKEGPLGFRSRLHRHLLCLREGQDNQHRQHAYQSEKRQPAQFRERSIHAFRLGHGVRL